VMAAAAQDGRLSAQQATEMGELLAPLVEQAHRKFMGERKNLWRLRDSPRFQRSR
jgi:hypothetical protein